MRSTYEGGGMPHGHRTRLRRSTADKSPDPDPHPQLQKSRSTSTADKSPDPRRQKPISLTTPERYSTDLISFDDVLDVLGASWMSCMSWELAGCPECPGSAVGWMDVEMAVGWTDIERTDPAEFTAGKGCLAQDVFVVCFPPLYSVFLHVESTHRHLSFFR